MRLFENFTSAVWGGAIAVTGCGLYAHNGNLIEGGLVMLVISSIVHFIIQAETK